MCFEVIFLKNRSRLKKRIESFCFSDTNQSAQNKFLNAEILRLNDRHHNAEKRLDEMKK